MQRLAHSACVVMLLGAGSIALSGCTEKDAGQNADSESAIERRIDRERTEAARLARQDERIKQLEKDLRESKKGGSSSSSSSTNSGSSRPSTAPAASNNASSKANDGWPGGSGHTVVIASLGSQSQASAKQTEATRLGLDAGILHSSNYSSLRPGYWVVFSGSFGTAEVAASRQSRARSLGFSDAYVRYISP